MKTPNITTQWIEFDKDTAYEWMNRCNTANRPVKDGVVERYAKDMREGRWLDCSAEPIIVDRDGVLVDGQHRLWAVTKTDCKITFLVVEGVDPQQRLVTDIGVPRNARDILSFEGVNASASNLAILKRMLESFSPTNVKPSIAELREAYQRHEECLNWLAAAFPCTQRGLRSAAILAPVGRAYYSQDRSRLVRFLEVFRTGIMDDRAEVAIILLRNQALARSASGQTTGMRNAVELYGLSERALAAFLNGEELKILRGVTDEQFPIADDAQKIKKRPTSTAKLVKIGSKRGGG